MGLILSVFAFFISLVMTITFIRILIKLKKNKNMYISKETQRRLIEKKGDNHDDFIN